MRAGKPVISDPQKYEAQVWQTIKAHPRKLILACGELALNLVTHETGITSWRGSVLHPDQANPLSPWIGAAQAVIPMLDPTSILQTYKWKALARHDATRITDFLRDPDTTRDHRRTSTHAANSTAPEILAELRDLATAPALAFDIETYGGTITCIGVGTGSHHATVIPLTGQYDWPTTATLVREFASLMAGPALKIGQNLDYDCQYLWTKLGIAVHNVWMDTMVAHACIQPELAHDLGTLTSLYTRHPYYKDMRASVGSSEYDATAWEYNGIDVSVTFQVAQELAKELVSVGSWDYFHSIAMPAQKTLIRMEHKGVRIDETLRTNRLKELSEKKETLVADPDLLGVNPRSPKQIKEKFAEILPVSLRPHKTDVHALKSIRRRLGTSKPTASLLASAILNARETLKIISTYLKAKAHADSRMRTSYRVSATETGRISSSKDVFHLGMNLQNVPKSQRDWFIPDPGLVFWEADASQIEARITAWLCGDEGYVTGFLDSTRDLHSENAAALFGIAIQRVHDTIPGSTYSYRDLGKRATHAINYGVGPGKLVEMMKEAVPTMPFTPADGKRFISSFMALRPGLGKWHKSIERDLAATRSFLSVYGQRRLFLSKAGDVLTRAAIAHTPQHMAAAHILTALAKVERDTAHIPQTSVLIQVHDSIGGQSRPEDLDEVRTIVINAMEQPLPISWRGHQLIVPAEFASGANWAQCK
jgi:DNA polymerase I-like protein with 3'-5' exonuclease and polymerase domains